MPQMPAVPEVLRLADVRRATGLPTSSIYDETAVGKFPRPIKIRSRGRSVGWIASEVTAWAHERIAARDARAEAAPRQLADVTATSIRIA